MANDSKKYVSLTRLSNFLDNIKAKYSQIGHKHIMSDLTDYKVDTTLSSTSNNPIANKTVDAEFDAIATAMGALDLAIDGKADASHTHDDRYYTESEIDTKLASKANSSHNHDSAYDAKGSASTVQENLDAVSDTLDAHTANSNIHFTAAERTKLSGIAAGAQVNTVTGVKGNSESTYRTGNINITKANIGLGNVDNTADANKSVKHATSADSATSATKATQDGNGKVISSTYETKSDASAKLTEAKTYADNAASAVKNDLLNGAGTAYDTLKELGDLIDDNTDAIGALETVAAEKADKTHSHAISDVSGLQSALDGKAASSHGTHVSFDSTNKPKMDGTAAFGTSSKVARADHVHPTDTSRAAKTDLDSHTSNTTVHITSTERSNWNAAKSHADSAHAPSNAEKNQNAFSNVTVGSTTIAADSTTDTLTLVAGTNVTITPDATNDKITISATDTNTTYSAGTGISLSGTTFSNSGVRSISTGSANGTISVNTNGTSADVAVKGLGSAAYKATSAFDAAGAANTALTNAKTYTDEVAEGKANTSHSHAISDVSGLQSALDGKAASSHGTHVSYSTTAPVMDGTASVGSASTVARSDHKHPTDTSRAAKTDLDSHTGNTTVHITSTERTNWNAAKTHADSAHAPSNAQANQNAFSNIKVGSTTIAADTTTDTLELVGSNVTITPDATNDKVTISVASGSTSTAGILKLTNSTSSTSTTTAATPSSVKSAYDLANTAKTNAATAQTRADSAYTLAESKVDSLSDLGVTATATELNYVDGVTSNVQTQIDDIHTEIDAKMNAVNPSGVGSFNLNRKSGTTVGDYSFTEGYDTTASGHVSHAEGDTTTASGNFSHTEGARTTASGAWSHAEGYWSTASGQYSHAEGYSTIAASNGQHAQGKFNIEDNQNKYAHIVGNGSSSKRANIHTLDWDGNAWFEGDIYIGGTSQDDTTASKVVTERYVEEAVANLDGMIYAEEFDSEATMVPLNADTLGGHPVEDFIKPKAGFIYPLAGQVVPEGFLLCDGAAYSRTEYSELFAAIGTIYGSGDGSTTFNVPNLQTRVPVGAGDNFVLGTVGGEVEHTLTESEMPKHLHGYNSYRSGYPTNYSEASNYMTPVVKIGAAHEGAGVNNTQSNYTGGSQPHNNMQPYTVVNYIIATGKDTGVSVSDVVLGVQAIPLGVEYGGTGATNAKTARENLDITPENIGAEPAGAVRMELLWENASPTSEFAEQTISLDLNGFSGVKIAYTVDITYALVRVHAESYDDYTFQPLYLNTGCDGRYNRGTRWSTTGVYFENGQFQGGTANRIMVPVAIYGIKGVS